MKEVEAEVLTMPTREDSTKQKRKQHMGTLFQGRTHKWTNTRLHLRISICNKKDGTNPEYMMYSARFTRLGGNSFPTLKDM